MADLQSNYVRKQLQCRKPQGEMVHAGGSLVNSKDGYNGFYKNIIISSITIINNSYRYFTELRADFIDQQHILLIASVTITDSV